MKKNQEFTNALSLALIQAGMEGKTLKTRRLGWEGVKARDKRIKAFKAKVEKRRAKAREIARARREKEKATVATVEQRDALWKLGLDAGGFFYLRSNPEAPRYPRYLLDRMGEAARGLGKDASSYEHWEDAKTSWRTIKRQRKKM